jgi:hypothetical protein
MLQRHDQQRNWRRESILPDPSPSPASRDFSHRLSSDSFLSLNSPVSAYPWTPTTAVPAEYSQAGGGHDPLWFSSPEEMLNHCTTHWREKFVTTDLKNKNVLEEFAIRPFFMLLSVDAPLMVRYSRMKKYD